MFLDKQWHQDKKLREKLAECINDGRKADLEGYVKACLISEEEPHFEALQHSADFWLLHSAVASYDAAQGILETLSDDDLNRAKNLTDKGIFNLADQLWDHANHLRDIEDFSNTICYECSRFNDSMDEAEKGAELDAKSKSDEKHPGLSLGERISKKIENQKSAFKKGSLKVAKPRENIERGNER
jgi:hypothetical protein